MTGPKIYTEDFKNEAASVLVSVIKDLTKNRSRFQIWCEVHNERVRQDAKFGENRNYTIPEWMCVLTEEVGEAAQAFNDRHFDQLKTDAEKMKLLKNEYRAELIQVAAVAVAAIEDFDRKMGSL